MNKKIIIILSIGLLLVTAAFGYYLKFGRKVVTSSADTFTPGVWEQTKFDGRTYNGDHEIIWGQSDGWDQYQTGQGVDFIYEDWLTNGGNYSYGTFITSRFRAQDGSSIASIEGTGIDYNDDAIISTQYLYGDNNQWVDRETLDKTCPAERTSMQMKITLRPYQVIKDYKLTLKQASFNITGKVTNRKTGAGISGVNVSYNNYVVTTGTSGNYTMTLPVKKSVSSYSLTASKSGFNNLTSVVNDTCGVSQTMDFSLAAVVVDDGGGSGNDNNNDNDNNNEVNPEPEPQPEPAPAPEPEPDSNTDTSQNDTQPADDSQASSDNQAQDQPAQNNDQPSTTTKPTKPKPTTSSEPATPETPEPTGKIPIAIIVLSIIVGVLGLSYAGYRYRSIFKRNNGMIVQEPDLPEQPESVLESPEETMPIPPSDQQQASINNNQPSAMPDPNQPPQPEVPTEPPLPTEPHPSKSLNEIQLSRPKTEEDVEDMDI